MPRWRLVEWSAAERGVRGSGPQRTGVRDGTGCTWPPCGRPWRRSASRSTKDVPCRGAGGRGCRGCPANPAKNQAELSTDRLVFIDETWTTTRPCTQGRASRRCRAARASADDHLHWCAVLREAYRPRRHRRPVERRHLARLQSPDADSMVSHKAAGVREATEAAGAELRYLPYSPNSIRSSGYLPSSRPSCASSPPARRSALLPSAPIRPSLWPLRLTAPLPWAWRRIRPTSSAAGASRHRPADTRASSCPSVCARADSGSRAGRRFAPPPIRGTNSGSRARSGLAAWPGGAPASYVRSGWPARHQGRQMRSRFRAESSQIRPQERAARGASVPTLFLGRNCP